MERTTVYECSADEFPEMTGAEVIDWLNDLARAGRCSTEELELSVYQAGDHWDGYSVAEIRVTRPETQADRDAAQAKYAQIRAENAARQEAEERQMLAALKAKYDRNSD